MADEDGGAAAEARKAESASWVSLWLPRSPGKTTLGAWVQAVTLPRRLMLATGPSKDLCSKSRPSSSAERK